MSILGNLFSRILPHAQAAQAPAGQAPGAARPAGPAASAQPGAQPAASTQAAPARPSTPAQSAPAQSAPQQPQGQGMQPQHAAAGAGTATMERVDVEQVLDRMPNPHKLNWRNSIVDLMKLVGMESTLQERKELADELGYRGDKNDTAAMNVWLHKEVMQKLEENGGKVPENLKD